jgi:DNA adenine methylase
MLPDMSPHKRTRSPLKTHGGKHYVARCIVALMPPHLHYVKPFAGGLSVLLARDPGDPRLWMEDSSDKRGVSEVVNDLDARLIGFWRVLQDEQLFARFVPSVPLPSPDCYLGSSWTSQPLCRILPAGRG